MLAETSDGVFILSPPATLAHLQENQRDTFSSKVSEEKLFQHSGVLINDCFKCVLLYQQIYCFKEYIVFIHRLFHGLTTGAECSQAVGNILHFYQQCTSHGMSYYTMLTNHAVIFFYMTSYMLCH